MITKRPAIVGVLGTSGGVSFSTLGFDAALSQIGHNTGNALFQHAVWERIAAPKVAINLGNWRNYKGIVDTLVIPAANQVNPRWDLGPWADMVEGLDVPTCVVGLGAQAWLDEGIEIELLPGTVRFLLAASARTKSLGVRGDFTARVLGHYRIPNTVISGCPSNFLNPFVSGHSIQTAITKLAEKEKYNAGYVFGTMEESTREVERNLFHAMRKHSARIVYQTNPHTLRYIYDGTVNADADKYLKWEASVLGGGTFTGEEYKRIVKWRGVFYSDARTWIDSMRSLDIVMGMRIHGAVAAIQSGSLGVCIPFDSRTAELVNTMKYPYVPMEDIHEGVTLEELVSRIRFDAAAFDEARARLSAVVDEIFDDAGI